MTANILHYSIRRKGNASLSVGGHVIGWVACAVTERNDLVFLVPSCTILAPF